MKAIYNLTTLCVVVEERDEGFWLEPVLGDHSQRFWLHLTSPDLLLDPTDDEIDLLS